MTDNGWIKLHRKLLEGIDYFPLWKPHMRTEEKFSGTSQKAYRAIRNSSNAFIKREDVRAIIMQKCHGRCVYCGSKKDLQIDHIISVYHAFKDKKLLSLLNTYQNLQILCKSCNAAKLPED